MRLKAKRRFGVFATTLVVAVGARLVHAEPPRVMSLSPAHGDILVDPALAEIRVVFDQNMDTSSYAWTGGGETFPKLTGKPTWVDARTCVLPVALVNSHFYQLGVNGGRFTGFRSTAGEPAMHQPLMFTTGPRQISEEYRALIGHGVLDVFNREAMRALREAIATHYSYRDRLGLDWDALFAEHAARLAASTRSIEFALSASLLLANAEDVHISIEAEGLRLQPHAVAAPATFNFNAVRARLDEYGEPSNLVQHGRIGDIGYLRINSWDGSHADDVGKALDFMRGHHALPALIIDVRANGGGNEMLARRLAGCFIAEQTVYSKHRFVDPQAPGGFGPMADRTFGPAPDVPRFEGPVAVLIGPIVCSSNESFVAMMDQVPACTLIGIRTLGSSGNPRPHDLSNGVTVFLPSWQDYLADGTMLEGRGIAPDVPVEAGAADFMNGDPVFDRAVRYLHERLRR